MSPSRPQEKITRQIRLFLASVLAIGALGAIPQVAAANIYWSNAGNGTIGRANINGGGPDQTFITGAINPTALAIGNNYIFWTNFNGTIGRSNIDGSGVNQSFITGLSMPEGIATQGNYVYWPSGSSPTIGRANLDGSGVNNSFITGVYPYGIAVSGDHIYWTHGYGGNAIGRANLDGSNADSSFISLSPRPHGIVADGNYIYWTNLVTGSIGRANLNGSGVNQSFITGATSPRGIVVDDTYVYWSNSGSDTIGRANLDGSGVNQSFITGADEPYGLAVDTFNSAGSLSPLSHDFGNHLLSAGPTSAVTFTLSSAGNANLTIPGGIELTGTGSDQFEITGGTCTAGVTSLPAGQSCTVNVAFDPFEVGSHSASLDLGTNAGIRSTELTGLGTVASPTIRAVGKATKRSFRVEIGCGDAASCLLRLTGNKIGTKASLVPETVSVAAGAKKRVTLASTRALEKALARGGRVEVTAANTATGTFRNTTIRIPR